jgi:hypothetical protein
MSRPKSILAIFMVLVLMALPHGIASADAPVPGDSNTDPAGGIDSRMRNRSDPNYVYSQEELDRIAAKQAIVDQYAIQRASGENSNRETLGADSIGPSSIGGKSLAVGVWQEPNDWAHRNYCGPASSQVALDARLPATGVPGIETLAAEEGLDPNWGVYMQNVCPVLNSHLGSTFYETAGSGSQSTFYDRVVFDIGSNYATVTGVKTLGMPGWSVVALHIVTIYGYNEPDITTQYIYYTETAGSVAGYTGSYWQSALRQNMWTYVSPNDVQCW